MDGSPLYLWEGREYQFEQKSSDWYWALGIIATAGTLAAVLFGNVLLALVIAAAAIATGLAAAKPSRMHRFAIYPDGVAIDSTFYPYAAMLHFSVLEYADEALPPSLSIKTRQFLSPHILIPIIGHDPVEIYEYIGTHLPEGNHHESTFDRLVELFRL